MKRGGDRFARVRLGMFLMVLPGVVGADGLPADRPGADPGQVDSNQGPISWVHPLQLTFRELERQVSTDRGVLTCDTNGCEGVNSTNCPWIIRGGDCSGLEDPVDQKLCAAGISLDGDVSDAISLGAAVFVDQIADLSIPLPRDPGPSGDEEQPLQILNPNGFNVARTVVLFSPDSDPGVGSEHDNSFLYIGFKLSDRMEPGDPQQGEVSFAPVPFDSDDNGRACLVGGSSIALTDEDAEGYSLDLQLCTNLEAYIPNHRDPLDIQANHDLRVHALIFPPIPLYITTPDSPLFPLLDVQDISMFPTAHINTNGLYAPIPGFDITANPSNGCIDREQSYCAKGNDVEIVIRRAESQAVFGPDPLTRRFSLAQMIAQTGASSEGDGGDEELASIPVRTSLPGIEVNKFVRCADDMVFASSLEILPGAEVEYEIVIRNTGNEDLDVTVTDMMGVLGTQGQFVSCGPACGTLSAVLTRSGANELVTSDNAAGLGLNADFFVDTCSLPDSGFLAAAANGSPIALGTLLGAKVARVGQACQLTLGDELRLRFRAHPNATDLDNFCSTLSPVDCVNSISVTGKFHPPPPILYRASCDSDHHCNDGLYCNGEETCSNGVCLPGDWPCGLNSNCDELSDSCGLRVVDSNGVVSTNGVIAGDGSDNQTEINLLCPAVTCDETICADVDTDGFCDFAYAATNSLQLACDVNDQFPIALDYTFTAANDGEFDFTSTEICKPGFVADAKAAGIAVVDCALCTGDCDGVDDDCAITAALGTNGPPQTVTCRLIIPNRNAWLAFAASDGGGSNCHSNGIEVTAFLDTTGLCAVGVEPIAESACAAEVCINPPCHLDVTKSFHCVEGCAERDATDADTSALEALPGATVEFEIVAANAGINGDPSICALEFTDSLAGSIIPCSDFCTVGVVRAGVESECPLPPDWLPIDGSPVALDLGAACGGPLEPGDRVVVRCAGTIPPDAGTDELIVNTVSVRGAAECPADGPVYCCEDSDDAAVDIDTCGLTVDKRATCDDPGAVIDPELVQTLPGATVGFVFDVCNTGDTPLPRVELEETLTCNWYVTNSVVATIEGADVTSCVCPAGGCATIDDLDGVKDLTGCVPGGIDTTACLTITFDVAVPADFSTIGTSLDCENTIAVGGFADICADPDGGPCARGGDSAGINVLVPGIECDKLVCADIDSDGDCGDVGDVPASTSLSMDCGVNDDFPIRLIYSFEIRNTGETPMLDAQACDNDLVADALAAGAEVDVASCALCDAGGCDGTDDTCAELGDIPTNGSATATCAIVFPTPEIWRAFAGTDDADPDCYTNGVTSSAEVDTAAICAEGAELTETAECGAEVCIAPPCTLEVEKAFRCIESCADRTPTGADTSSLHVLPGATVEFEIVAANAGTLDDPSICSLRFIDTLTGAFIPCADTCVVQVINGVDDPVCDVPGDWLPLDGSPVELDLVSSCGVELQPGDQVVVRCAGTVDGPINNLVRVAGAAECTDEPVYCCEDDANATVVVDTCDYTVAKDVTCDDPRAPGAVFDPDLVDALPGSTIGFRIQLANTGTVALPRLNIGETMDCVDWFVPGSVVADIDGADVTACICATDNCPTFADLSGDKDLTACPPGAVPAGGTLTITFKVKVPDEFETPGVSIDCTNTVTIRGESDVCADATTNACPPVFDDASIDVRVPEIECEEAICADLDQDGDCDEAPPSDHLSLGCDVVYPVLLFYEFTINNPGEAPYAGVDACKPDFVRRAVDAEITVGPCDLCDAGGCDGTNDDCAEPGPIPAGGSATLTCVLSVPSFGAWTAFAGGSCDANEMSVTGHMDTTGVCSAGASVEEVSTCGAQACIDPPCTLEVEKTFRCIEGCDDRTAVGGDTDLLEAMPGATVEFEIRARNNGAAGDPDICSLEFRDTLTGPFVPCDPFCTAQLINSAGDPDCTIPDLPIDGSPLEVNIAAACGGELLEPGDEFVVRCAGSIPPDATIGIVNNVTVQGAADCPANMTPGYCCEDSDDATVDIETCGLEVSKDVTCDDPRSPTAAFDPDYVDALPGSTIGFRVQVCNTGDVPLTEVEFTDTLDCGWPIITGSVNADVDGADVTDCICTNGPCATLDDLNGRRDLTTCVAGGIATNGCLTVTFEVQAPVDFNTPGTSLDCKNFVEMTGFSDVCASSDPDSNDCPRDIDTAGVNLLVPDVTCDKEVCADINNDGDCEDLGTALIPADIPFASGVSMACDVNDAFPIRLIYRITVNNPGETDLASAHACDPNLVACAVGAGAIVGPCDLCDDPAPCDGIGDECADVGPLPFGDSAEVFCEIEFPTPQSWVNFAACDGGDENCHSNGVDVTALVDTTGLCADGADLELISTCGAQTCLSPPCDLEVSKTVHCIESCAARTPTGADTNALPVLPGMAVEFEITITNAGDPNDPDAQSICSLRISDTLNGPFTPCTTGGDACVVEVFNDSGSRLCPLPGGVLPLDGSAVPLDLTEVCGPPLEPGDRVVIRCAGVVDGQDGDIAGNAVVVEGATVCVPGEDIVYCCEADSNAIVEVNTCAFTIQKDVACDDGAFVDSVNLLPGGSAEFRIQVCNTGSLPLPIVEINESLSCPTWFVPGSVEAFIGGTDVTACICPQGGCDAVTDLNGSKNLDDCVPGGISTNAPNDCLTITFDVEVPPDYAADDLPIDCTNSVTVGALTEVCASGTPDTGCGSEANDDASIDVQPPAFACAKTVAADYLNDETENEADTDDLQILEANPFPILLTYKFNVENQGGAPLTNVQVCDANLVADALAAGATVEPATCALCSGPCDGVDDTCADLMDIDAGSTGFVTCAIVLQTEAQYATFAARDDGDSAEYVNEMTATADADTNALCGTSPILDPQVCSARIAFTVAPPLPPVCFPLTKASFTTWNENEVKFTGLDRCILLWDQTPFSLYGEQLLAPNHLLVQNLHTAKGKAQINGLQSQLCVEDDLGLESVAAPLVGVAHKLLYFNGTPQALAGMELTGIGLEEGYIRYDLGVSGGAERPEGLAGADRLIAEGASAGAFGTGPTYAGLPLDGAAAGDDGLLAAEPPPPGAPRGVTSQKGSLLVFPKVELRWRQGSSGNWELAQDTFIELTNDFPADVWVQMYFVHGDRPLAYDPSTGERAHPGCNWVDVQIGLTASEPTYWSAYTGFPKFVSPWDVLDPGAPPGRPAQDGTNDRVLRGYVLAWAVKYVNVGGRIEQHEIAWNHLAGAVTIVNYAQGEAWSHAPWAFQTVSAPHGTEPDLQPGVIRLNGVEYEAVPDMLLLDFYATGSTAFSRPPVGIMVDSDLTLLPLLQDLRQR